MIDINKLKNISSLSLLDKYEGKNPYLKKLKREYVKDGKINFTDNQLRYIADFHNVEPTLINRVISITEYLGQELKEQNNLPFVPVRIMVHFILAESDKWFHVYGKLSQKQKESGMYWLPKTQVLDDPYWEEPTVEVDFKKYAELDTRGRKPYPYQEEGVKFLLSRNGCILADSMGTGKTIMSIIAAIESGAKKILVVCPSSVKINWEREIQCFGEETSIISGKKWNPAKFTIINFDILKNFHTTKEKRKIEGTIPNNELIDEKFDLVIVDEAHNLKNHNSIRGKIMTELCVDYGVEKVWLLTGTPIANRPMDFYNLLKLINSPIVKNWAFFVKRYCDGRQFWKTYKNGKKKKIWLTDGASNLEELSRKIRNIILRRLKEEVLDLPEKVITPMYHRLDSKQKKKYYELWDQYVEERKALGKRKITDLNKDLVELTLLKQFMAIENIEKTVELVENAIEQGEKIIIFTSYQEEQNILKEKFGKIAVVHNGSMSETQKQKSVDNFQEKDKIKVFIGNIISAGVGITLTQATTVVFNSLDWVPGNVKQAIDRAHRIGQKKNVSVYFNIFEDTVDERVWKTLFSKTDVIEAILGGKETNIFTSNDNDEYLELIDNILHEI